MKIARSGGFAAYNSGTIVGCIADVKIKSDENAAGFVYSNKGNIQSSLTLVPQNRGTNTGGFVFQNSAKNNENIINSAWYMLETKEEKRARTQEKKDKPIPQHANEALREKDSEDKATLFDKYGLGTIWKEKESKTLIPDIDINRVIINEDEVIEISSSDKLLEIIELIRDGDKDAAYAHYKLTDNINLKGKSIMPIGTGPEAPFSGIFDGNCFTISNFKIDSANTPYAGFFGYVKDGMVINLTIDYMQKGKGGSTTGGMVGFNQSGTFKNCQVYVTFPLGATNGGFVGSNAGRIETSYVRALISKPFPIFLIIWPLLAVLVILLTIGSIFLFKKLKEPDPFIPEIIDGNARPVDKDSNIPPPPEGTNRISIMVAQDIAIDYDSGVGAMYYTNPRHSTQDVVIRLVVSDEELLNMGYNLVTTGVRTEKEIKHEDYDPETSYTTLYRSGLLKVGYQLDYLKISGLPDGTKLKVGEYQMLIQITAYDPETNEMARLNPEVKVTIEIVK